MNNIPKIAFSTFADGNFGARASGRRLAKQAKNSNLFTLGVNLEDLNTLYSTDPEFRKRNSQFISEFTHGLGNYIWKPKVLIKMLSQVKNNEFVCYLDSGCQLNLNIKSIRRLV